MDLKEMVDRINDAMTMLVKVNIGEKFTLVTWSLQDLQRTTKKNMQLCTDI